MTTTTESDQNRPVWPYPDVFIEVEGKRYFARMTPHKNGQWVKKIPGTNKLRYFGLIDDPDAAIARWRAEWPKLVTGETPGRVVTPAPDAITVKQLCNRWYKAKRVLHDSGELHATTLRKYKWVATKFAHAVGKDLPCVSLNAAAFLKFRKRIEGYKLSGRADIIAQVRGIFRWGVDAGLIDQLPVYGREFARPQRSAIRRERHASGVKPIPAEHIRKMLEHADVHLKPVILLGINAGMKTLEVATIGPPMLDLDRGVIAGVRRKTGTALYAPLWPETVEAIRSAACGSGPILQWQGRLPWNGRGTDRIGREFKPFCEAIGLPSYTHGQLRHTLRTVGGRVDREAVRRIMGQQTGDDLDEIYDHADMKAEARKVVDAVRLWLWPT